MFYVESKGKGRLTSRVHTNIFSNFFKEIELA